MTPAPGRVPLTPRRAGALQRHRQRTQAGFFALFVLAPVFDIFRFDLTLGYAIVFGYVWRLGIDDFLSGKIGATEASVNILLRLFLPLIAVAAAFLACAWRWGRLYCGWLCPHFSVVETLNRLMRRATGRPSLWEKQPLPARHPDGSDFAVDPRWWLLTAPLAIGLAFAWAVVLLTYLLPPDEVYSNLWRGEPTRNQALFIGVATFVLSLDFLFARHLFCRFGCAVGLFQSLAWMSNRGAMVVGFRRRQAAACNSCYASDGPLHAACEGVCPMRLRPRMAKHKMFACTQCGQCIAACATVQGRLGAASLLSWVEHEAARRNEARVSLTGSRHPQ